MEVSLGERCCFDNTVHKTVMHGLLTTNKPRLSCFPSACLNKPQSHPQTLNL